MVSDSVNTKKPNLKPVVKRMEGQDNFLTEFSKDIETGSLRYF